MNTILSELEHTPTGQRKVSGFRQTPVLDYQIDPTGNWKPGGFQPMEEHRLTVTVGIMFWTNNVMFEESRRQAEETLMHRLYGGTLALLAEASHAIHNGDPEGALRAIHEIKRCLTKQP